MLMQSLVAPKKFVISSSSRYSQGSAMEQDGGTRQHFWVKALIILLPVFGATEQWIPAEHFSLSPVFVSLLALYGKMYNPIPSH